MNGRGWEVANYDGGEFSLFGLILTIVFWGGIYLVWRYKERKYFEEQEKKQEDE